MELQNLSSTAQGLKIFTGLMRWKKEHSHECMCGEQQSLLITWLIPSLWWSVVAAAAYCGGWKGLSAAATGRLARIKEKMNAEERQREEKVTWDWNGSSHYRPSMTWSIKPRQGWNGFRTVLEHRLKPHRTSVDRPEDDSSHTPPIQSDRAWQALSGRMGLTAQIQVSKLGETHPIKLKL